jgi:hypothetical protein
LEKSRFVKGQVAKFTSSAIFLGTAVQEAIFTFSGIVLGSFCFGGTKSIEA